MDGYGGLRVSRGPETRLGVWDTGVFLENRETEVPQEKEQAGRSPTREGSCLVRGSFTNT